VIENNVPQGLGSFFLNGPAGRLEALLNAGTPNATHAALVCHPHPVFGGTIHNKVVYRAMKALNDFGFPALRFNFRGAGLSEGEHDHGRGEVEDVRTALDWLDNEFHLPIIFCGFSFGAATGLRAAWNDQRVVGLISLGTPVNVEGRAYTYEFFQGCKKPKLFISGSEDQFSTREALTQMVDSLLEPKKLVIVDGADHFFEGQLPVMQAAIRDWVSDQFHLQPQAEAE
jgi:alpha/beta superfamily hydrolase